MDTDPDRLLDRADTFIRQGACAAIFSPTEQPDHYRLLLLTMASFACEIALEAIAELLEGRIE